MGEVLVKDMIYNCLFVGKVFIDWVNGDFSVFCDGVGV